MKNTNRKQVKVIAKVGDGATMHWWTDSKPCTVVRTSPSGKNVWVQMDDAKLLNGITSDAADKLDLTPGGFLGHVEGKQRYEFTRNTSGPIHRVTLRKDGWRCAAQGATVTLGVRFKHHDYNF